MLSLKKIGFAAISASAIAFGFAIDAKALILDVEGPSVSGLNDNSQTAQYLGIMDGNPFDVVGYIDEGNSGDVDIYEFVLGGSLNETVFFDMDFANSGNSGSGVDTMLTVFDSAGTQIGFNDDNSGDPGSEDASFDPFLELDLSPDTYFVSVTAYNNRSDGNVDSFNLNGSSSGFYSLQIRTGEGFNAPANVNPIEVEDVPEPTAILGLMVAGTLGLGLKRRK